MVEKEDAAKFAEAGFLVIAIKPGHITTLYPDGNRSGKYSYVVQAGAKVSREIYLNNVWSSVFGDVKTYVYLGHIFFN